MYINDDQRERVIEILIAEYEEGQCNCIACRDLRYRDKFWILFGNKSNVPFIPRNVDPACQYNDINRHFTWKNRFQRTADTMLLMNGIWDWNKRRIPNYKKHNTDFYYCSDCGKVHKRDTGTAVTYSADAPVHLPANQLRPSIMTGLVCDTCLKNYNRCEDCGDYHPNGAMKTCHLNRENWDGERGHSECDKLVCHACFEKTYAVCNICGITVRKTDSGVESFVLPPEISYQSRRGGPNEHLCSVCASAEKTTCKKCGISIYRFISKEVYDGHMCYTCHNELVAYHDYMYKPPAKWRKSKKNPNIQDDTLFFGVELEIENRHKEFNTPRVAMAHQVMIEMGRDDMYVKSDSSLHDGIEIVTHPFTWQQYKEDRDTWVGLFCFLENFEYGTTERCGIHVHLSKAAFTTLHMYKFIRLFYEKLNRDFIFAISERPNMIWFNDYCRFYEYDEENLCSNAKNKKNASGERHSAVSLYQDETAEVRIFQSTIEPEKFFKIMEFLKAAYDFSKDNKISDMVVFKFVEYVMANQKMYSNLFKFINDNFHIAHHYPVVKNLLKGV